MLRYKNSLKKNLYDKLKEKYSLSPEILEIGYPPQSKFGDLALTFPFELAKKMKTEPRKVAQEIVQLISPLEGVEKIEVAGPGYINLFLDKKSFFSQQLLTLDTPSLSPQEEHIIVEHTNINPNKAAHIGHLRNACLGDTLVRCLKHKGEKV